VVYVGRDVHRAKAGVDTLTVEMLVWRAVQIINKIQWCALWLICFGSIICIVLCHLLVLIQSESQCFCILCNTLLAVMRIFKHISI
jgi:hypothetical protein